MGLFDLFSNDTADEAARKANEGRQQGYDQLSGLYQSGRDALTTYGNAALDRYGPLLASYGTGAAAYGDASGANGVEGLQRATNTFKNSGQYGVYGFGLDQGLQALDRTHAAAGNLSSGNADTDAMKYATGLAGNAWNQYQTGLAPYLQGYGSAVQGAAGIDTGIGTGINASDIAQGNAANTTQTGIGATNAAAEMNNYQVGANQLNALMGAAKLAMSIPTGGASLFSGFGGGGGGGTGTGATFASGGQGMMGGVPFSIA
jgi:hypothetical protein